MLKRSFAVGYATMVFLLFSIGGVFARNSATVDSLIGELNRVVSVDARIRIYLDLAEAFRTRSTDSAFFYLRKAEALTSNSQPLLFLGLFNQSKGNLYNAIGHPKEAENAYRTALYCFRKVDDRKSLMVILNTLGNFSSSAGNFSEALKFYLECKEIADAEKDQDMQARLFNNMGKIYAETNDFSSAVEYYLKAIRIFERTGDSLKRAAVQLNLASTYSETDRPELARQYLEQASSVSHIVDQYVLLGLSSNIQAHSYFVRKQYDQALQHLFNSLKIVKKNTPGSSNTQQKILMTRILDNIGWAYFLTGEFMESKDYLRQAYRLSESLDLLSEKVNASNHLSHVFEKTGQPDSAIFYMRIYKRTSDSLLKIQSINIVKLAEVRMQYEKEVRDKQLQISYNKKIQQRNLIVFISVGLVLLALIIILVLRLKMEKQKKNRIQVEMKNAELEKKVFRDKLETQNKELVTKVMHSTTLNELVIRIAEKLKKMELDEESVNARMKNEIIRELLSTVNKEDSWKEFEIRFQNVQVDFYDRLRARFNDLSNSEIRLCAFLRLNMSTKEISAITHQSERAIVVARYRLRQKLGLQTNDNLAIFLSEI